MSKLKEDKEFGNILAGQERAKPGDDDVEWNTPIEDSFVNNLKRHISTNDHHFLHSHAERIENFLANGEYDDIIVKPQVGVVFRGMKLATNDYLKLLDSVGLTARSVIKDEPIKLKMGLLFKPLKSVSSWTQVQVVAEGFSLDHTTMKHSVVLCAKTNNNNNKFFDLNQWYNQIDDYNKSEREVIGVGEILVESIIVIGKSNQYED